MKLISTSSTHDAAMTFQGSDTVSGFYTKLKTVWREIDAYGETPHCDCGKCECNVNGIIIDNQEKDRLRKFLMGLNEDFRQVRSTILSSETLPKLSKVFQIISHEEAQQNLTPHTTSGHAFFAKSSNSRLNTSGSHTGKAPSHTSQNPTPQNIRKRPPPPSEPIYYKSGRQINTRYYCFHCSTFGHSDEKCYAIHGLPQGHKYSKGSNSNPPGNTSATTTKPLASAHCVAQTSSWSAWEERPKPSEAIIRYKRNVTTKLDKESDVNKEDKKKKPSDPLPVDIKSDDDEEDPNPIGPYGFPLYSDKYNPKLLPKRESGDEEGSWSS